MKKMTKFMSVLLVVAMVLSMVACGNNTNPTTTNPSNNGSTPSNGGTDTKKPYVVEVKSVGGLPLKGVNIMIYDGDNMVQAGSTTDDGTYSVSMKGDKTYTVKLSNVPAGYQAEESYSFSGGSCKITLTSSLVMGEDISGARFELGNIMYDFTFTDCDGVTHNLAETLAGKKAVVLNFWYNGCAPCKSEFPAINAAYKEFSDDIAVFALNDYYGQTNDKHVVTWRDEMQLTFPMAISTIGLGPSNFGYNAYPTTVVVDRYGAITMMEAGSIPSEYMWKQLFAHYAADDYKQVLITEPDDFITSQKPTATFPGSDVIDGIITQGDLNVEYTGPVKNIDGANFENYWPFIEAVDPVTGEACVKSSNSKIDSSYAVLHANVELKAGQALGFDYIISSQQGADVALVLINGQDIYQLSGYDETPQWKSCYPWVALEDGTYTLSIYYAKDGSADAGDDAIYVKNLRIVDPEVIDVETYIPRQAAVKQADGSFKYVEIFYNEVDGYYHVNSVNGPLLLANLMAPSQFNQNTWIYQMAADGEIVKDGHDYKEDLTPYANYANNASLWGFCTVTQELAELLKIVAEIKGFDANDENEWLQICEYYQVYGSEDANLGDPIKGLAPFSAPVAVLGKWVENADGELVFQGENGETGDYNRYYYDRPIMPRGMFYRFTPEVSGVYRITSHAQPFVGSSGMPVDAWIFTEEDMAGRFEDRAPSYTYSGEERFQYADTAADVSIVYYMEAGKSYYINIAFWNPTGDLGYIPFDLELMGATYNKFCQASPGTFTYLENSTNVILSGGIDLVLVDGVYYHLKDKGNGQPILDANGNAVVDQFGKPITGIKGSAIYADFMYSTAVLSDSILTMIDKGYFDFTKTEQDELILYAFKLNNYDVEATKKYMKEQVWGADYDVNAEKYDLDGVLAGKYHGTGVDKTEEIRAFISQMIDEQGALHNGCVIVTAELAEILQMLMDKFTFEGVEYSWAKLCYYYEYLGQ